MKTAGNVLGKDTLKLFTSIGINSETPLKDAIDSCNAYITMELSPGCMLSHYAKLCLAAKILLKEELLWEEQIERKVHKEECETNKPRIIEPLKLMLSWELS